MARVTGPLMSIDASGTLAGALVFAKWRGRNYVRRHAVPSNPRTASQVSSRAIMKFVGSDWKNVPDLDKATWEESADAKKVSPFNEYIAVNCRNWRDGIPPAQQTPPARILVPGTIGVLVVVVSGRQLIVTVPHPPNGLDWGFVLCRFPTTGFTPGPANAIAVVVGNEPSVDYADGPLAPGDYFYNAYAITTDGLAGTPGTEDSGTVT